MRKTKNNFRCEVKNPGGENAELYIYGDICGSEGECWSRDDVCPSMVISALDEVKDAEKIDIYINSGGGDVFAGIAIYNRLKSVKAHKTVHIDALAASIASVIALAGDEVIMPENSFMMIHKAWTYAMGNADDLRACADRLETIEQSIVSVYDENSECSAEEINEKMSAETWLDAAGASEMFGKVRTAEPEEAAACVTELCFKNAPAGLIVRESADRDKADSTGIEDEIRVLKDIIALERSIIYD